MKVKCISTYPDEKQLHALGPNFNRRQTFGVSIGTEYLVLGIEVTFHPSDCGNGSFVNLQQDAGHLVRAPLCLFEIVDSQPSRYWRVKFRNDGTLTFWPESFYQDYYADDLFEGVPEVVADFRHVRQLFETEARGAESLP